MKLGFTVLPGEHPIIPVMLATGGCGTATDRLLGKGVRDRFVPRRPARKRPHPHPDVRGAHPCDLDRAALASPRRAGDGGRRQRIALGARVRVGRIRRVFGLC
jgi:hypothetical protein